MATRQAQASWQGSLKEGQGHVKLGSGAFEGPLTFKARFEDGSGTNPEELIGAAHAGCFSMAFSSVLGKAGYTPDSIETQAAVELEKKGDGFEITKIDLTCKAKVPKIGEDEFNQLAMTAKENCPVSKALAATSVELDTSLAT